MAPPIPFTNFPGIIQFAISPYFDTYIDPKIVKSKCPPLIIPKDSALENIDDPGINDTVSYFIFFINININFTFPAFIRSAST